MLELCRFGTNLSPVDKLTTLVPHVEFSSFSLRSLSDLSD